MARPRIVVADGNWQGAQNTKALIEPHFHIAAIVTDGHGLLVEVANCQPDLVLLELALSGMNGLEAVQRVNDMAKRARVVFLTVHTDRTLIMEAFRNGASGYVLKQSIRSELVFALQEVMKGHFYLSPYVTRDLLVPMLEKRGRHLSGGSQDPHSGDRTGPGRKGGGSSPGAPRGALAGIVA